MAREEIIENIRETLNKPPERERVVYLFVEIRKLIDKLRDESGLPRESFRDLKYWCDWSVHTKLDRDFARNTLNQMESYIVEHPGDKFHWSQFNSDFVGLESLRRELYQFLNTVGLSSEITNIPPWDDVTALLVAHLRDCPLTKPDGLVREFRFIRKSHIPEAERYSVDYQLEFDGTRPVLTGSVLRFERDRKTVE